MINSSYDVSENNLILNINNDYQNNYDISKNINILNNSNAKNNTNVDISNTSNK